MQAMQNMRGTHRKGIFTLAGRARTIPTIRRIHPAENRLAGRKVWSTVPAHW